MWEASLSSGGQGRHFPGPCPSLQKSLVSSELPLLDLAPSSAATRTPLQRHQHLPEALSIVSRRYHIPSSTGCLYPKFRHKWASLVTVAPSKASTSLSTVTFQKTTFHAWVSAQQGGAKESEGSCQYKGLLAHSRFSKEGDHALWL